MHDMHRQLSVKFRQRSRENVETRSWQVQVRLYTKNCMTKYKESRLTYISDYMHAFRFRKYLRHAVNIITPP